MSADSNSTGMLVGTFPIATITGTVFINSGTAIAAGASITENYTFTGAVTTDTKFGLCPRDAVTIPKGLVLTSLTISATNTVTATWKNNTAAAITPPATATWSLAIFGAFFR